jgi:uncharacterized protein (TIGR04255 family)
MKSSKREGENLSEYLIPELLGLHGKLKGITKHAFSETMAEGTEGSVISRTIIQEGQVGFPPDLQLNDLKISQSLASFRGVHAIIDTDAFFAERLPFDLSEIKKRLSILHDRTNEAFRSSVTQHALDVWA